jgi:hypothetical protein
MWSQSLHILLRKYRQFFFQNKWSLFTSYPMHFINSYINCYVHSTIHIYNGVLHNCRRNLENANPQTLSPQFHVMSPIGFELLLIVVLHLFSTLSGALVHFKKFDSLIIASHKYDRSDQIHRRTCIRNLLSRISVHNN